MSNQHAEIFMRYLPSEHVFEFRMGESESLQSIKFEEKDADTVAESMRATSPRQAEIFLSLLAAAKNDENGAWVSAANKPLAPGQARL